MDETSFEAITVQSLFDWCFFWFLFSLTLKETLIKFINTYEYIYYFFYIFIVTSIN